MSKLVTKEAFKVALRAIKDFIEKGVENYVKEQIEELNKALPWDGNSDINSYTETGIYHFAGYRKNANDHLPIDNVGNNANIAFTLIVDRVNGYYNETDTTINDIPGIISQTIFLGNRQGTETKIYVRNGNIQYSDTDSKGVITWEAWRELMQTTYLGVLNSYDALNTTTEIGLYTGAMFNFTSRVADVFKLEVINNYAVTTQVSAATGLSTPPNSVLQTITILNLDGSNATKKRIGTYNGNGYTWGEWKDTAGTPIVRVESATSIELTPNARTIIEQPIETLRITFGGISTTTVEEYSLVFIAGGGTQLTFENEIQWANATAPTFVGGTTYEINIIDNLALYTSYVVL